MVAFRTNPCSISDKPTLKKAAASKVHEVFERLKSSREGGENVRLAIQLFWSYRPNGVYCIPTAWQPQIYLDAMSSRLGAAAPVVEAIGTYSHLPSNHFRSTPASALFPDSQRGQHTNRICSLVEYGSLVIDCTSGYKPLRDPDALFEDLVQQSVLPESLLPGGARKRWHASLAEKTHTLTPSLLKAWLELATDMVRVTCALRCHAC